ncbi:hypothetical protein GS682_28465 [Nostoc sp. B(2019)]|nr:hypothetical protein [Nostoc sp. B(2019)]
MRVQQEGQLGILVNNVWGWSDDETKFLLHFENSHFNDSKEYLLLCAIALLCC